MLLPRHPGPWKSESLTPSTAALLLPQGSSLLGRLLAQPRISTCEAVNQTHPLLLSARQHPHPARSRGSVRRLPVHAEAVDAGVFGVAPIAQHPELHQLVCAHGVTLQVKCLDGVAIMVVGELSKEKALLLSFFL